MKKTISIILALTVLFGMVTVLAAGNQADPLITKNYADGTYRNSIIDAANASMRPVIADPIARINALEQYLGFEFAPRFTEIRLNPQDNITLKPGAGFTLTSGSAAVLYGRGTIINISTGAIVSSGSQLIRNQRYLCAEETTAVILANSAAVGYVDGFYRKVQSQISLFVERLYNIVLGRPSEPAGLLNWVNHIVSGRLTPGQVAQNFFFSAEFIGWRHSNDVFVDRLYRALMNREPEPAGMTNWLNHLQRGMTRQAVFNSFVASPEFTVLCRSYGLTPDSYVAPIGVQMFIIRLYSETLGRHPDPSGFTNWINHMQRGMTGTSVARSFVFSAEVTNRGLTNDQFIELLYRTLLGRDSDPSGKANWLNHMRIGRSRDWVFNQFAASPEFAGICSSHSVRR